MLVGEAFMKYFLLLFTELSIVLLNSYMCYLTGTKLSEDSRKYGSENTCTSGSTLSRAALSYSRARAQMEKERGSLLKDLTTQVSPSTPKKKKKEKPKNTPTPQKKEKKHF